jgi:diacylglycerol kinase (ATP)
MPVTFIINPTSGWTRPSTRSARPDIARRVASSLGVDAEVMVTERVGHARELARDAVARGVQAVLAWGGDGTINEVASALAFGEVPLGIIPAGSGNGLARELRIDPRPERAIAAALGATARPIDVGDMDGRLFVNIAGIGADAQIASRFNAPGNRRRGLLGYANITVRVLAGYVPAHYRITTADGIIEVRALLVTFANSSQFGNGARIAPGALLDDGLLDLVVLNERSALNAFLHMPRLFTGAGERIPGCRISQVTEATVESDQPLLFHLDGELCQGGTTVHARVHRRALKILA